MPNVQGLVVNYCFGQFQKIYLSKCLSLNAGQLNLCMSGEGCCELRVLHTGITMYFVSRLLFDEISILHQINNMVRKCKGTRHGMELRNYENSTVCN